MLNSKNDSYNDSYNGNGDDGRNGNSNGNKNGGTGVQVQVEGAVVEGVVSKFAVPDKSTRRRRRHNNKNNNNNNNNNDNSLTSFKTIRRRKNSSDSNSDYSVGNTKNNYTNSNNSSKNFNSSSSNNSSNSNSNSSSLVPLIIAVLLWYSLGVVSISSSKVLLTPYVDQNQQDTDTDENSYTNHYYYEQHVGGLSPLYLTFQQLLLGSTFLRLAIKIRLLKLTNGVIPIQLLLESFQCSSTNTTNNVNVNVNVNDSIDQESNSKKVVSNSNVVSSNSNFQDFTILNKLICTGGYFCFGFLTTNMAFGIASPTYVETLKAAEPISSAIFAVCWGIEKLTLLEILGICGIISGVLISCQGTNHTASMVVSVSTLEDDLSSNPSLLYATCIVVSSNLCFSLRGLYQKLFRRSVESKRKQDDTNNNNNNTKSLIVSNGNSNSNDSSSKIQSTINIDDLNLQFRMQQIGVCILIIPCFLLNGSDIVHHIRTLLYTLTTKQFIVVIFKFVSWSILNGLSFSAYNLASTYLLTRISVIHHAALNCTRRIFAILSTSIIFQIPITIQSMIGITISFISFMIFTYGKHIKNTNTNKTITNSNGNKRNNNKVIVSPPAHAFNSTTNNNHNTKVQVVHTTSRSATTSPIPPPPIQQQQQQQQQQARQRVPPPPPPPLPPPPPPQSIHHLLKY